MMMHQHEPDGKMHVVKLQGRLLNLQPEQSLQRIWSCRKDGFQKVFGLDKWNHVETICKPTHNKLFVRDQILWHEGTSQACRDYIIETVDEKMSIDMKEWSIELAGLPWPVRAYIQQILKKELPTAADKSIRDFYDSRALEPPPAT